MSKTLSLPPKAIQTATAPVVAVKAYTADELRAMLAEMGEPTAPTRIITDTTMDLSIDGLAPHVIADKANLPPVDERAAGAAPQIPAAVHGKFGLNGIPLIAPGVDLSQTINPATGQPYAQIGTRAPTQIQAPPQNFSRRRG